jgi:hypothetical protein
MVGPTGENPSGFSPEQAYFSNLQIWLSNYPLAVDNPILN